ncbi:MAG TPA: hypothetical protein VGH02_05275 [Rhizomicrobium sp.]|jgi:hypothetical protein
MPLAIAITLAVVALLFANSSTRAVLSLARMRSHWIFVALPLAALVFGWLCYAALWESGWR